MSNKRWKHRPEGSNWGDFGADDQFGRLNLLTAAQVRKGAAEVWEGRSFGLSLPMDYPGKAVLNPRRVPPRLTPSLRDGCPCFNWPAARGKKGATDLVCDDLATISLQYSTHWDSFAHVGSMFDVDGDGTKRAVYYNGFRADEHIRGPVSYAGGEPVPLPEPHGAQALDVANYARKPIQGRAVLLDFKAHFGLERRYISRADIEHVLKADDVTVEPGDILVLRTGFTEVLRAMNREPDGAVLEKTASGLDGRDPGVLDWITKSGIAAIAADNYAVELLPARAVEGDAAMLPLHEHCLFRLGIPLGELWWLAELADWLRAAKRSRFLLTAPALHLPGAVGSPVTPVGTV